MYGPRASAFGFYDRGQSRSCCQKKTSNVQPASARDGLRRGERSTLNVELRKLNVGRWTLDVGSRARECAAKKLLGSSACARYLRKRIQLFCHVERSRDISYYIWETVRDSSTSLGMTEEERPLTRMSRGGLVVTMSSRRAGIFAAPPHKLRDFPLTSRYLIGVSGGRDSVALLHWLVETGYRDLIVCHLDHQLRGRAASADARFVENLAKDYGLQVEIGRVNVRAIATQKKSQSKPRAASRVMSFLPKRRNANGRARFSSRIMPMIWSKLS